MSEIRIVSSLDEGTRRRAEDLVAEVSVQTGRPALSDDLLIDLRTGDPRAVLRTGPDGELQAYAQLTASSLGTTLEIVGPADPVLTVSARGLIAQDDGGFLSWWVTEPTAADEAAALAAGMTVDRELFEMRRSLPLDVNAEIDTRAFVVGQDEDAWLRVNNRAFADHAEQGGWTREVLADREAEPWFDPEGFRLHERNGALAGFCWTKVHDGGTPDAAGEIYVIAVDPDFHGLGLGRQMTLAGLDHLASIGLRHALLYVAGENESAVGLYESLGFEVTMRRVAFGTVVVPR